MRADRNPRRKARRTVAGIVALQLSLGTPVASVFWFLCLVSCDFYRGAYHRTRAPGWWNRGSSFGRRTIGGPESASSPNGWQRDGWRRRGLASPSSRATHGGNATILPANFALRPPSRASPLSTATPWGAQWLRARVDSYCVLAGNRTHTPSPLRPRHLAATAPGCLGAARLGGVFCFYVSRFDRLSERALDAPWSSSRSVLGVRSVFARTMMRKSGSHFFASN